MSNFIPRYYKKENDSIVYTFEELIQKSQVSIILGEPASGKTFQLEYFDEETDNSKFVELIFIEEEDDILETTQYILIDSIDEALLKNDSDKQTIRNLTKYIKDSLKINPNVKIIITCRYLEWKEFFENKLKEIDEKLLIYDIQELSKEDIDKLLMEKEIELTDFWSFISENFLDELLKNVLMIINIIENFESYKSKNLKYFEIYDEIIKEHLLAKTENERKKQLAKISFDEMKNIASSLAMYFTMNHNRVIDLSDIDKLADEIYKIDGTTATGEKLDIFLDSALFSGKRNKIRFFHKSIQEYLSAYFIYIKNLDIKSIKNIFSHDLCFYEEFEEIVIYLTNIEKKFFKHFVSFDPFIYRRHPYLESEEQKILLKNMLILLTHDEQSAWHKWEYLENSTLVKFDTSIDIVNLIKNNTDIKNINHALFDYLISILEHNDNVNLQTYIFEILEYLKQNKDECFRYIKRHRIENIDYNRELFKFLSTNDMLDFEEDNVYIHIFQKLYKHENFLDLIVLLNGFSLYGDKRIIQSIDSTDIILWFDEILNNYQSKYQKIYNDEQISFLIFLLLQYFEEIQDKDILKKVFSFLDNEHIYSYNFYIGDYEKEQYSLEFNHISTYFWAHYFSFEKYYDTSITSILFYYKNPIKGLDKVIEKYPISNYKDHYLYIRSYSDQIENYKKLILDNDEIMVYLVESERRRIEHEKKQKWYKKRKTSEQAKRKKEKEDEKTYKEAIDKLEVFTDIWNIYHYAQRKSSDTM